MQICGPKAQIISGGKVHPESYRLTWKADEPFGRATGWAGRAEAHTGNGAKALELLTRAERLSPQDPRGWFIPGKLAFVHFMERRYSEAAMSARRALEKNPRSIMSLWLLAASFVKQGQEAEAREVIQRVITVDPKLTLIKLRKRTMFVQEAIWQEAAAALHAAGLPA